MLSRQLLCHARCLLETLTVAGEALVQQYMRGEQHHHTCCCYGSSSSNRDHQHSTVMCRVEWRRIGGGKHYCRSNLTTQATQRAVAHLPGRHVQLRDWPRGVLLALPRAQQDVCLRCSLTLQSVLWNLRSHSKIELELPLVSPRIAVFNCIWKRNKQRMGVRAHNPEAHRPEARLGLVRLVAPVPMHLLREQLGVEVQVEVLAAVQERAKLHLRPRKKAQPVEPCAAA